MQDILSNVLRDLSEQLTALAKSLGEQVQQIPEQNTYSDMNLEDVPDSHPMRAMCQVMREQRKRRLSYFPAEIFHEPSWDMLLMLYIAQVDDRVLYVKTLVLEADAPITTSQRWIDHLAKLKLIVRTEDSADRRRIQITLSDKGRTTMEKYLSSMVSYSR